MLPVSGGTVGFQDLCEETEQNEKAQSRSQTFHNKPRNWKGTTEHTSSQLPSKYSPSSKDTQIPKPHL